MLAPVLGGNLTIFNYHRIRPDEPDHTTPFDAGVYGPTASQFYEQMKWIRKYRKILSEADLISCLATGRTNLKHRVAVSFDDGYRDNDTLAYPILKELGIPAFFFIPTAIIK